MNIKTIKEITMERKEKKLNKIFKNIDDNIKDAINNNKDTIYIDITFLDNLIEDIQNYCFNKSYYTDIEYNYKQEYLIISWK